MIGLKFRRLSWDRPRLEVYQASRDWLYDNDFFTWVGSQGGQKSIVDRGWIGTRDRGPPGQAFLAGSEETKLR